MRFTDEEGRAITKSTVSLAGELSQDQYFRWQMEFDGYDRIVHRALNYTRRTEYNAAMNEHYDQIALPYIQAGEVLLFGATIEQRIDVAREALRAARSMVANPAKWTQGAHARDAKGRPVPSTHHGAVQWDPVGALSAITRAGKLPAFRALCKAASVLLGKNAMEANDTLSHPEVINVLDYTLETM